MSKIKYYISILTVALTCNAYPTISKADGGNDPMDRYFAAMKAANDPNINYTELQKHVSEAVLAAQSIQKSNDPDTVLSGVINEAYASLPIGQATNGYKLLLQKAPTNISPAMRIEYIFTLGALQYSFDKPAGLQKMNEAISSAPAGELQTHFIMLRDGMLGHAVPLAEGATVPISLENGLLSKNETRSSTSSCQCQMMQVCDRTCYYPPNSAPLCEPANCAQYDAPRNCNPPLTP